MAFSEIKQWWLTPYMQGGEDRFQRQLVLVEGSIEAGVALAESLLAILPAHCVSCSLGDVELQTTLRRPIQLYRQLLGNSFQVGVYNGHEELRPSALLALAGTITQGGRLIILCPPLERWPFTSSAIATRFVSYGYNLSASNYIKRMTTLLGEASNVARLGESMHLPLPAKTSPTEKATAPPFRSSEQAYTFDVMQEQLRQGNSVLITAKRGRGKTSLLGLVCAALIQNGAKVLITSSAQSSVKGLFDRVVHQLPGVHPISSYHLDLPGSGGSAQWLAPDHPGLASFPCDFIIIDEAASFPVPQLEDLVKHHQQVLLSTTVNGYEGSGQGFINRFVPDFQQHKNLAVYVLHEPLRWQAQDPVEPLMEKLFLFEDNSPALLPHRQLSQVELSVQLLTMDKLSQTHQNQVMALLNTAHYQTTPDDMMRLMDAPDCICAVMFASARVVGAAIVNVEGGARLASIAEDIASGKRRVKGHLSAQSLAHFSTIPACASFNYWRINRIAITGNMQAQGLGTQLVEHIRKSAQQQNIDVLSSSFGASLPLLAFWAKTGFKLIKLGVKADKASGKTSAMVALVLNEQLVDTFETLQLLGFDDRQAHNAPGDLIVKAPGEASSGAKSTDPVVAQLHLKRLQQFVAGARHVSHTLGSLHWVLKKLPSTENSPHRMALQSYLASQNRGKTSSEGHLGQKEKIRELRAAIGRLLKESETVV